MRQIVLIHCNAGEIRVKYRECFIFEAAQKREEPSLICVYPPPSMGHGGEKPGEVKNLIQL